jgi:5-methylcytosine-specific restriction endonuclease McrA
MTESRQCTRCEQHKLPSEFYADDRSNCKECERTSASARMNRYNKTLRGRASQALQNSRKTINRYGYDVPDDLTIDDVVDIFKAYKGECVYCNAVTSNYSLEHLIPLSAPGSANTKWNCAVACMRCNRTKHNKPIVTHFFENPDKFPDEHFVYVVHYMAHFSGKSVEDVVYDLANHHADYLLEKLRAEMDREFGEVQ